MADESFRRFLRRPFLRTENEVEKSRISWPFTTSGSIVVVGPILLSVLIAIVTILVLDSTGTCTQENSWPISIWGVRDEESRWCERHRQGKFIAERSNTMSNFAFIIAGFVVVSCGFADLFRSRYRTKEEKNSFKLRNHVINWPSFSFIYGIGLIYGGVGAFLLHANRTSLTNKLDIGSIWWMFVPLCVYALALWSRADSKYRFLIHHLSDLVICILNGVLTSFVFSDDIDFNSKQTLQFAIGGLVGLLFLYITLRSFQTFSRITRTLWPNQRNWKMKTKEWIAFPVSASLFVIAYLCQESTITWDCDTESLMQPHAAWHTFAALGFFTTYMALGRAEYVEYDDEDTTNEGELTMGAISL